MPTKQAQGADDDDALPMEGQVEGEEVELLSDDEPGEHQGDVENGGEAAQPVVADARLAEGGEVNDPNSHGADEQAPGQNAQGRHKKTAQERKDQYRRAAKRYREERDYALQQNFEIMQRLAAVEGSAIETRLLTVDGRLVEHQNDADTALNLEAEALKQGDTEALRQARQIREAALSKVNVLKAEKDRLTQAIQQRASRPPVQQPPVPGQAEIQKHVADFKADKPWLQFGPQGQPVNRESAVLHAIDLAMQGEGRLHANEPEYWAELNKRAKAALPHLFGETDEGADDDDDVDTAQVTTQQRTTVPPAKATVAAPVRKGPVTAGSGRQATAGPVRKRLSPERVDALKQIGVWDARTPAEIKERDAYIKEYEKYDREHGITS
jgi:hypothetical protein